MIPANDPEAVRRLYYTDESWRIRQSTHDQYSVPPVDFTAWALGCVRWRGDESVLDVGSGPGRWYTALKVKYPDLCYTALDLHEGMLAGHPGRHLAAVGHAERLPFRDGSFDVVMANHMLYHVPDIEGAVREFRRVLRPDGLIMATTNSAQNMPELQVLLRRAVTLLVPPGTSQFQVPAAPSDLFTLETGTRLLARYFYGVVRYDLPSQLVFPSVEPVLEYLESTRPMREPQLPLGVHWDDMMVIVREQINRLIDHFGELVISKLIGVLVATDRGDFLQEYMERRAHAQAR